MELDPSFESQLTRIGALKDCEPDREWFEKSVERSRKAIEFGRAEADRELARILAGTDDED